jgi:hypothetical protein
MESDSSSIGKPPDIRSNPRSKILNPKHTIWDIRFLER